MEIGTSITANGQTQLPDNLINASYAVLVPNGQGGYNQLNGTGTANGTFTIPNVPAGSYYLKIDSTNYLWTSASNLDLGYAFPGRPDVVSPTIYTPVNFSISV